MQNNCSRDEQRRDFFNACADGWEDRNYPPHKLAQIEPMLATLGITQGMTIVDVGCGQGVLLPFLCRLTGDAGRIAALDPAPEMLRHAAGRHAVIWPLLAPAERIPLLDGFADMVLCFSAFPHIGDKAAAAREFYRVLKPGCRAHVLHIDGREKLNALHDQHHAVCGDHLPCPHGMQRLFGDAGFVDTRVDESEAHYYFSALKPGA